MELKSASQKTPRRLEVTLVALRSHNQLWGSTLAARDFSPRGGGERDDVSFNIVVHFIYDQREGRGREKNHHVTPVEYMKMAHMNKKIVS